MEISLGKRKIEINPFVTKIKEDSGISGATLYSEVGGDAGINGSLGVALVDRDAGINVGGVIADTKGDVKINGSLGVALVDRDAGINVGGVIADTKGDVKINGSLGVALVEGDAGINVGGVIAYTKGDAGINGSLGVAFVDGNAGINVGGVIAYTKGDAGINGSLGVALVDGDVKINVGGVIADTKELSDYKVKDVYKRITKYLPQFIQQIDLPAFNIGGVYTETGEMGLKNSCVLGLFNNIVDTDEDYIALGIINRIKYKEKDGEKRVKYGLLCSGRVHIDGIFSHREKESNLEKKVD